MFDNVDCMHANRVLGIVANNRCVCVCATVDDNARSVLFLTLWG